MTLSANSAPKRNAETISVEFSSPASGQQAIRVIRNLQYRIAAEQPRIAEVVEQLSGKFGYEPVRSNNARTYRWLIHPH